MRDCNERELWVLGLGDNVERGALVCSYLAEAGYWARTGLIQEIGECRPLGVILDISPYSTDGWGILLEMKKNAATRDIPIMPIYLSQEGKIGEVFPVAGFFTLPIDSEFMAKRLAVLGCTEDTEDFDLQVLLISRKGEEQVAKTLEHLGFEVINAYTGKEAVALATTSHPYMIVCSLMLSDMGAFDMIDKFRLYPQTRNIPFFILLKDAMKEGERMAISRSVDSLVSKKGLTQQQFLSHLRRRG